MGKRHSEYIDCGFGIWENRQSAHKVGFIIF